MCLLGRSKCCLIGISVCAINQATVFWQNSNEGEWIVINSVECSNHGALPHSSQPILSLATVTDRGCCVKTVNCHFSNDGHLDGSERLRSAVYGLGAIWAQTLGVWRSRLSCTPRLHVMWDTNIFCKHENQEKISVKMDSEGNILNGSSEKGRL